MNGMKIQGKNITHMRGDTAILSFNLMVGGEPFVFRDGDVAYFSVKKNLKDKDYVLQKKSTNGQFVFRHEDTQDIPFGQYWYDVQLKLVEGQVVTAVGPARYRLMADVTGR